MKKANIILFILFLTGIMQSQDRPQPKPGKTPEVNIKKPQSFVLPNGLKVMIVENHKLPKVSFNLSLDNPPSLEGKIKGVDALTGSLMGNGSKKISKNAFNEEIDLYGASLSFSSNGAYANSLSKFSGRVLELMADAALNPNFTQEEFDKDKAKMLEELKSKEKDVPSIANKIGDALAFGKNHPMGEFTTVESLKNVTLADVETNYKNYFSPEHAYLVVIGDVNFKKIKPVIEKLFGSWEKRIVPKSNYSEPQNVAATQINFVDMPNAVQSEIALVNTLNLKMSDPDYFPAIFATHILGGDFNSYLNMNLREAHGWTYGARAAIGSGKYVNAIKSKSSVRNVVTDSAVVEFIKEIKKIRSEKVSEELLNSVKASFIGKFVMQVQQPQAIARFALRIQTENLPEDFYENYIKSINAVTPEQVQQAANKYFLIDNTRIIIVGKGADVIPGLEKLKIPMFYFDKLGNEVAKPALKKAAPTGVTAKNVFENYIQAIGGQKAVAAVKTISALGSTKIPQAPMPLTFTYKSDAKGKLVREIAMGTMSLMKQVVNEKEAYIVQQGNRKKIEGTDLIEMKATAVPFEELELLKATDNVLTGVETLNGNEVYAIISGKTTRYYDCKSGLKVSETRTQKMGDKTMNQTTTYTDYREVKGIKIPFEIIQNVGVELDIKLTEVKIDEGVSEADFK